MSLDHLRNSTYLHADGAGNFRDERRGVHGGTPSVGNTDKIRQSVAVLLGDNVALTANKSVDLDRVYGSAAHNSLGLQVAISGRADVVQSDVAAHLGEYQGKRLFVPLRINFHTLTLLQFFRRPHQIGPWGGRRQLSAGHYPPSLCRWRQGRNHSRTCPWTVRFFFLHCTRVLIFAHARLSPGLLP